MDIPTALDKAMTQEGLSFAKVAVICGVTENAVRTWRSGAKKMSGRSVIALQRSSKVFRSLTLGDLLEAA